MLGSMSRAIGGQGRRAMSGSALTRGGMYNWRVAAILNALERAGKAEGPLEIADLTALGHLDQYHYLGTAACDEAAVLLGIGPEARVLDVGSGIGGPARYLAHTTGCSVTGVELQADLADAATELTSRVVGGLGERVRFATEVIKGARTFRLAMGIFLRGLGPRNRSIVGRWPSQMAELRQLQELSGIEGCGHDRLRCSQSPTLLTGLRFHTGVAVCLQVGAGVLEPTLRLEVVRQLLLRHARRLQRELPG